MCASKKGNKGIVGYLTHDLTDNFGRLLLKEGTPLSQDLIDKLKDRKICFRTAGTPLSGCGEDSEPSESNSVFTVDSKQLDKKFKRLDIERVKDASQYLSSLLHTLQGDFFLSSNIKALSQGCRETYSHSINVGIISVAIAKKMNFNEASWQEVSIGALLHDVGKMLLPPSAFKDCSKVGAGNEMLYRQHPILGADLLAADKLPAGAYLAVRQHHEKYSGGGYPDGIKEREIHINSYVVSVADVFDRLTTGSPDRDALSPDEAIQRISLNKSIDFHPDVVDSFIELFRR